MHNSSPSALPWAWLAGGILLVLAATTYLNALDVPLLVNDPIFTQQVTGSPLHDVWRQIKQTRIFRPWVFLSYRLDSAIYPNSLTGFHITNIVLHTVNTLLLYLCLLLWSHTPGRPRFDQLSRVMVAAALTWIWAVYPGQALVVSYIGGRGALLAGFFGLCACLLLGYRREVSRPAGRWGLFAAAILALLAAGGARETGFIYAVMAGLALINSPISSSSPTSTPSFWNSPYLRASLPIVVVIPMVLMLSLFSPLVAKAPPGPLFMTNIIVVGSALVKYCSLFCFPFDARLSGLASGALIPLPHPGGIYFLYALIWLVGLPWALIYAYRRRSLLFQALLWLLLVLIVEAFLFDVEPFWSHRFYLAAPLFMLAALDGFHYLKSRAGILAWSMAFAALMVIGVLHTFNTWSLNTKLKRPIEVWQALEQVYPDDPFVSQGAGYAYFDAGRLKDAETRFALLLKFDAKNYSALLVLGEIKTRQKQYEEAASYFQRAVFNYPQLVQAYIGWGNLLTLQNKIPEARSRYLEAQKIAPQNAMIDYYLAWIAYFQNDFPEAEKSLKSAMARNVDPSRAYHLQGLLYLQKKDFDQALEAFYHSLEYNENNAQVLANLGIIFQYRGDNDRARHFFEKAHQLTPGDSDITYRLAEVEISRGNFLEGLNFLKQALEAAPHDTDLKLRAIKLFERMSLQIKTRENLRLFKKDLPSLIKRVKLPPVSPSQKSKPILGGNPPPANDSKKGE